MKKLLQLCSVVLVLITGCSNQKIGMDSIDLAHENNIELGLSYNFAGKGNTLYFQSSNSNLFSVDKDFNVINLGSLSYSDDKKVDESSSRGTLNKYVDTNLYDIYYYDSKLYFMSQRMTVEGEISYVFNSIDEKGENRKELMKLDYYPITFIIQKGYVVIVEWNQSTFKDTIHVYDQSLNEVKVIEPEGNIYRIFAEGDNVYLDGEAVDNEKNGCLILHLNDLSTEEFYENDRESLLFFRENTYATRRLNKSFTDDVDFSELEYASKIYDKKTNEVIFEVTNELIGYYDDEYIYTTTLKNPNVKYRVYDFNHQLIKEITPSDSLPREARVDVIFSTQDFDSVYRVFNNHIISGTIHNGKSEIIACSLETGVCNVMLEEE